MIKTAMIDPVGLFILVFLSRIYQLLIIAPSTNQQINGTASMLGILLGMVASYLFVLPLYWLLRRHKGIGLVNCRVSAFWKSGRKHLHCAVGAVQPVYAGENCKRLYCVYQRIDLSREFWNFHFATFSGNDYLCSAFGNRTDQSHFCFYHCSFDRSFCRFVALIGAAV